MSLKNAAEELLKIADELEVEANSVTAFVCDKCNHTATLADINARRKEAAEKVEGQEVVVDPVTVNDQISCPACDGVMSYRPTEASEKFYFEPKEGKEEEEEEEKKEASINYDSLEKYLAK